MENIIPEKLYQMQLSRALLRLAGQADIGWSNRLGWYEGFHLLLSVNPEGVITGFSFRRSD